MKHSVGTPRKRRIWCGPVVVGTRAVGAPPYRPSKHADLAAP